MQDFVQAHPECTTCLLGASDWDGAGPYVAPAVDVAPAPAVLLLDGGGTLLDEGACWAAAAALEPACGSAVVPQTACVNGTCGGCPDEDFASCQTTSLATDGACHDVAVDAACAAALEAKRADIVAACGTGGAFKPYYTRIANFLCGAAPH